MSVEITLGTNTSSVLLETARMKTVTTLTTLFDLPVAEIFVCPTEFRQADRTVVNLAHLC